MESLCTFEYFLSSFCRFLFWKKYVDDQKGQYFLCLCFRRLLKGYLLVWIDESWGAANYEKWNTCFRSSLSEVFLGKDVLKITSKFTEENPFQSVVSTKLFCNFIETTLRHGFSLLYLYLLHTLRTLFYKNTSGELLLLV